MEIKYIYIYFFFKLNAHFDVYSFECIIQGFPRRGNYMSFILSRVRKKKIIYYKESVFSLWGSFVRAFSPLIKDIFKTCTIAATFFSNFHNKSPKQKVQSAHFPQRKAKKSSPWFDLPDAALAQSYESTSCFSPKVTSMTGWNVWVQKHICRRVFHIFVLCPTWHEWHRGPLHEARLEPVVPWAEHRVEDCRG